MSSPLAVPPDVVRDAIAMVADDGRLIPCTPSMTAWIAKVADHIDRLPLAADQRAQFDDGEEVLVSAAGRYWSLARRDCDGHTWLCARDVDDRERRVAADLQAARCRRLAEVAANLVHDLSNQLNAVLALSGAIASRATAEERAVLHELEQGTKLGSRMARTLARLLSPRMPKPEVVDPAQLVQDALSLVLKSYDLAGVDLVTEVAEGLPAIRTVFEEAVQAVISGPMSLLSVAPETVRLTMTVAPVAIAGARVRNCVVLRCHATSNDDDAIEALLQAAALAEGALVRTARDSATYGGLGAALLAQRRFGGDLLFERADDGVRCEYVWPAVPSARTSARPAH